MGIGRGGGGGGGTCIQVPLRTKLCTHQKKIVYLSKKNKLIAPFFFFLISKKREYFYFLISKENHILKRVEPQIGTPQEYTRSIQRGRIQHKRKAETKKQSTHCTSYIEPNTPLKKARFTSGIIVAHSQKTLIKNEGN